MDKAKKFFSLQFFFLLFLNLHILELGNWMWIFRRSFSSEGKNHLQEITDRNSIGSAEGKKGEFKTL